MKFPRYWARGKHTGAGEKGKEHTFTVWKWSDISLEEAQKFADEAARRVTEKFIRNEPLDRYGYSERPLREEVVEEIGEKDGNPSVVVSRNSYGALVLNTAKIMFIDIDFPEESAAGALQRFVRKIMGGKKVSFEEECLEAVRDKILARRGFGARIYRTFKGLRCLVTSREYDPSSRESTALLHEFGSDALYVKLCEAQKSYRARLTPKPWRCGSANPPVRFPWENREHELRFRDWQGRYESLISTYRVCNLLDVVGSRQMTEEMSSIVKLHDDRTGCFSDQPLA